MYNDYYLISIDNKLDNLQTLITNQETIIRNQETIIENQSALDLDIEANNFLSLWCVILGFAILLYHFYHTCFNKFR